MEPYDAMMDQQLPVTSNPNQTNLPNYQTGPISFPSFSDNPGYGSMPGMAGSYPTTPTTPVGNNMSMGGGGSSAYNTPASQSQQSPYNSSQSSFSMPYDPPGIQSPNSNQSSSLPSSIQSPSLHQQHSHLNENNTPPHPHNMSNKSIYSCSYCGLVLSSNNALIEHKRIHTGERPYACHICSKRFTQKAHLNIHKRIHTGEKPYACHICHKRFAQSSHLSSHKRIHTGEKPFVCGICHIGFTQKQRLDAHLKKHMERPGEEITVRTRQPSAAVLAAQAAGRQMDPYHQGMPRDDPVNMMHMVGQGMPYIKPEHIPYIKQEVPSGDNIPSSNTSMNNPTAMDFQSQGRTDYQGTTERQMSHEDKLMDDVDNGNIGQVKTENKDQNINTPSFSSEGMFLHPSGYVAYGGIEDDDDDNNDDSSSSHNQQSSRVVGQTAPTTSDQPQQSLPITTGGAHRRKSQFVRKRMSESPSKDGDMNSSAIRDERIKDEMSNGLHRFNSMNSDSVDHQKAADDGDDTEIDEEYIEDNDYDYEVGNEFKDTGEMLDDKRDPPYQGNVYRNRNSQNFDPHHLRRSSSSSNQNMPQINGTHNMGGKEIHSHLRRGSGEAAMMNGDRVALNSEQTLSYVGPDNSPYSNSGLVKVNNRVSLVNFTAEELLSHMLKRDDVHCCRFCCLIFQDAAMYHIHRNMHDKQDIRKCNLCGKLLLDKYDFTAHFLSMHQN